ncbi:RDD family protein [Pontibacter sp. BT310]|uniref:RDD family protein n=1 Tax=Pontibacter populi TaxID=890055 RepID=A0ABS6XBZ3_9BACT|nr:MULTISPECIES: RDD family protein [Pontibacter]MBJ6118610.1 RDD family protein [Pontibacter sp. BT310]MBR0571039.1 RDD family protein [Microvirga sp. STS03]MBW3365464.1 RDD family protein [Pontibacter populi]
MDKSLRPSVFKRLLALAIDFILLGILGYLSGFFLESFYVALGQYGTLFGSAIVISYFAICQSRNGQTIGKRFMGIKVTDPQGEYLTLGSSFLRAFILFFPVMNVEMISSMGNGMLILAMLLTLTILISIYFTLVNNSRRSLHDILASSIVTFSEVSEFELREQNDRTTKKIMPIAVISILLLSMGVYQRLAQNTIAQMLSVKEIIEQKDGVLTVNGINSNTTTVSHLGEDSRTYTSISLKVRIDKKSEASNTESSYFEEFYEIIQNELPESRNVDLVSITLFYGYDIGIASKTQSVTKTFE